MNDALRLRLELDPAFFARYVMDVEALDPWQVRFMRSEDRRVLCNVHRQGGKSSLTACVALRKAVYEPAGLVLILAPALRQAGELLRKISRFHRRLTGEGLVVPADSDRRLGITFANGSRIECLPGGGHAPDTIRGFSAPDITIYDEMARCSEELFVATLPMITVSKGGGRIIGLSTPNGKKNVWWRLWSGEQGEGWTRVEVPITAVERISPERVRELKASMFDWQFRQEALCSFEGSTASLFDPVALETSLSDDFEPLFPVGEED